MSLSLSHLLNPAPSAVAASASEATMEDSQMDLDVDPATASNAGAADSTGERRPHTITTARLADVEDVAAGAEPRSDDQKQLADSERDAQRLAHATGLSHGPEGPPMAYNVLPPTSIKTETDALSHGLPSASPAPTTKPRPPSKSTTKNEGMHSDKRYLCYLCYKLFTRRRSVRDHICKIHNTKTWDPTRSLEIIVNPATGDPVEPLDAQIAQLHIDHDHRMEEQDRDGPSPPPPVAPPDCKLDPSITGSRASSVEHFVTPASVIGKKRPAPASASPHPSKMLKKGTAKPMKHATPKRKPKTNESDSVPGDSPTRSPSATPASARVKATAKLAKPSSDSVASSPAPSDGGQSETAYEDDVGVDTPGTNDDGEVFCICRKGDNHTWMIACDGPCEEWFHGNCVNIRERDGDLIDKYICPRCQRDGFQTTWKRMCRRKACRKPARVFDNPPSKYCSADCGRKFMVEMIKTSDPNVLTSRDGQYILDVPKVKKTRPKVRRTGVVSDPTLLSVGPAPLNADGERQDTPLRDGADEEGQETDSSADDADLPNRGGRLRAGEIKAIVEKCASVEQWRQLGTKPVEVPVKLEEGAEAPVLLDTFERTKLDQLADKLARYRDRRQALADRETFLELIKARSTHITDEVRKQNPKSKDPCGFDPRLSWTDDEFLHWRSTPDGAAALSSKTIGPPDNMHNGYQDSDDDDDEVEALPTKGGVCVKNRCVRHGKWQKAQLAEVRFEQDLVARKQEMLEREERAIRHRALLRAWEQHAG